MSRYKRVKIAGFLVLFFCWSCSDKKIDTTAVKEEMKAREIKVVPEAQVLEKAMELGKKVMATFTFSSTIVGSEQEAIPGQAEGITANFYPYQGEWNLSGKEKQLFEAYVYNAENGIKSEPNVQNLDEEKAILFTAPVFENGVETGVCSIRFSRKFIINQIDN